MKVDFLYNNDDVILISSQVEKLGYLELGVCPQKGAGITHFTLQRKENTIHFFRPVSIDDFQTQSSEFFACFPLVPFSGRIRNATFNHNGIQIQLTPNPPEAHALHGDGWKNPWKVLHHDTSHICVELTNPNKGWPWDYSCKYTISLKHHVLQLKLEYTNLSTEKTPLGLGFHPWFPPNASFKAKFHTRWDVDAEYLYNGKTDVGKVFTGEKFHEVSTLEIVHGFSGWNQSAEILWNTHPYCLELTASGLLQHAVVYTQHPSKSWCFEPVTHSVDAFNLHNEGVTDTGVLFLDSKDTIVVHSEWKLRGLE